MDINFGVIKNPYKLELMLKSFPGIIETGLFLGMADLVYIGTKTDVRCIKKKLN